MEFPGAILFEGTTPVTPVVIYRPGSEATKRPEARGRALQGRGQDNRIIVNFVSCLQISRIFM